MSSNVFAFKEFEVRQDKCPMKVCTDSVLLGAWANPEKSKKILDIGTGTGIIALMLAQRSGALIDAIDVDKISYTQAKKNFSNSKWSKKIKAYHTSIQKFSAKQKYDLIVSNPPYFCLPSTHKDKKGIQGRYTHLLPFDELADSVVRLLASDGKLCVILPIHEGASFANEAEKRKLYLTKYVWVKTTTRKKFPKRILMEFEFTKKTDIDESMLIIQSDNNYTDAYKELTKEYYLHF